MTAPDPRVVAERIRAETGVDLFDPDADAAAASVAMRRSVRQVAATVGGGMVGAVGLIFVVLAFARGDAAAGARVAYGVVGVLLMAAAVFVGVWGWRLPAAYREVVLPRRAARTRFFAEVGQPEMATSWLARRALVAYSTPAEVREMRAERKTSPPPEEPRDGGSRDAGGPTGSEGDG